jgi:hypothetical protein
MERPKSGGEAGKCHVPPSRSEGNPRGDETARGERREEVAYSGTAGASDEVNIREKENLAMPTVIYRDDNRSQVQRIQDRLGNVSSGRAAEKVTTQPTRTVTTVYEKGFQAQKGAEPMQNSPDFWTTFTPTKRGTL